MLSLALAQLLAGGGGCPAHPACRSFQGYWHQAAQGRANVRPARHGQDADGPCLCARVQCHLFEAGRTSARTGEFRSHSSARRNTDHISPNNPANLFAFLSSSCLSLLFFPSVLLRRCSLAMVPSWCAMLLHWPKKKHRPSSSLTSWTPLAQRYMADSGASFCSSSCLRHTLLSHFNCAALR